jgi:hypothetical protein
MNLGINQDRQAAEGDRREVVAPPSIAYPEATLIGCNLVLSSYSIIFNCSSSTDSLSVGVLPF